MRWAINPKPQDRIRIKHALAERRTVEEATTLPTDNLIGVYVKPENCEETIAVLFGMQKPWIYPNSVRGEDKFVVLVRMPEC